MKTPPLLAALAAFGIVSAGAGVLDDLAGADQEKVKSGVQVVTQEPLDGYPWPRVRLYRKVDASPKEVMAIFFDYDNAKNFVPNCDKSVISKKIDARTYEVDYVVDIPILPDEAYTVRNKLSKSGESLQVDWRVLKATSVEESEGSLVVEPYGKDGAILRYTNLVKPSSRAAGLLKGLALGQMKDTVDAIVDEVMSGKQSGMKAQLDRLNAALEN